MQENQCQLLEEEKNDGLSLGVELQREEENGQARNNNRGTFQTRGSMEAASSLPPSDSRYSAHNSGDSAPKSVNHNFQKHAVVTIKKLTRGLANSLDYSPIGAIARQMWNIFLSCGLKSKRMLVILFGKAELRKQKYQLLLKGCFFGELCNYQQSLVQQAQNMLRGRAVAMLTQQTIRSNVERNRHIRDRQGFLAYFFEFLRQLREGPLLKLRINHSSSKRILEQISTRSSLLPSTAQKPLKIRHRRIYQ